MDHAHLTGAEAFLRVLFPRLREQTKGDTSDRRSRLAHEVCHTAWERREDLRRNGTLDAAPTRVMFIVPTLGPVDVFVSPECLWVAWDDQVSHPKQHLAGATQEPDIRPMLGAMEVSRLGRELAGDEGWVPYFDTFFSPRLLRAFTEFKRASSGVDIARRTWAEREQLRAALDTPPPPGVHVPAVLDAVPYVAHAGCLTCDWLDGSGASMLQPGWREAAMESAQRHADQAAGI